MINPRNRIQLLEIAELKDKAQDVLIAAMHADWESDSNSDSSNEDVISPNTIRMLANNTAQNVEGRSQKY